MHGPLDMLKRDSVSLNVMPESLRSYVYVSVCVWELILGCLVL